MKRKIFSVLFALVLVLSFSLITAVPMGAQEETVVVLSVEPTTGMSVEVGESFDLEVWARFSDPLNVEGHSWNAADVIFQWDPNYLQLNGGTFSPTFSMAFWPGGGGVNDTWDDGDAGIAVMVFGREITWDQLLITLDVTALAPTESTTFNVVDDVGPGPSTMVIEPYTWVDLSGTYYGADIEILPPPIEVEIDIKPGSDPNSINLKSKGVVPVAVLTTDDFDASTVDPETVDFAGAEPVRSTLEDVDGDEDLDMLFHFKTQDLKLDEDSTDATLTGETDIGLPIVGTEAVNIVPKKGK